MYDGPVRRAHADLDLLGAVLADGATLAPDFGMRAVIAMRERLNRHVLDESTGRCAYCVRLPFPCPDVLGDLQVLGITAEED